MKAQTRRVYRVTSEPLTDDRGKYSTWFNLIGKAKQFADNVDPVLRPRIGIQRVKVTNDLEKLLAKSHFIIEVQPIEHPGTFYPVKYVEDETAEAA